MQRESPFIISIIGFFPSRPLIVSDRNGFDSLDLRSESQLHSFELASGLFADKNVLAEYKNAANNGRNKTCECANDLERKDETSIVALYEWTFSKGGYVSMHSHAPLVPLDLMD